mgnify:CR=1 FL=1
MSDLSTPPLSLVPVEGEGAAPAVDGFAWPTPPYACYPGPVRLEEPEPCQIEGMNGRLMNGVLLEMHPAEGLAKVRIPPARIAIPLRFNQFRKLVLTRPLAPLDSAGAQPVQLTHPDERNAINTWLRKSGQLIYSSVPIDRTAQGGTRSKIMTTFWVMDPLQPEGRRKLAELEGGGWAAGRPSPDERVVALTRYLSANESQIWTLDLASGTVRQVAPSAGSTEAKATYAPAGWSPDGRAMWIASDRAGEFRELMKLDLASGRIVDLFEGTDWELSRAEPDANCFDVSRDGRRIVFAHDPGAEKRLDNCRALAEIDLRTRRVAPLAHDKAWDLSAPRYSPDGQRIAYVLSFLHRPQLQYRYIYSLAHDPVLWYKVSLAAHHYGAGYPFRKRL